MSDQTIVPGPATPMPRRGDGRRKWLLLGCGGLVLLCTVLGLASVLSGRGSDTTTVTKTTATERPGSVNTPGPTTTTVPGQAKAPEAPKAAAPAATPLPKVGDAITSGNWEYRVTQVKRTTEPLVWSDFGNKSEPKGEWLVIDVDLKNVGKQNFGINTFDFEVVDGTGVKYDHSTDVAALGAFQKYQKLSALGEQYPPSVPLRTALVFDIAPGAKDLKLSLKQARTLVDLGQ